MLEVVDGGPLAEELGVRRELDAIGRVAGARQERLADLADARGRDRALDDDEVAVVAGLGVAVPAAGRDRLAGHLGGRRERAEVDAPPLA